MKILNIYLFLLAGLLMVTLTSCTETIELELPQEETNRLVVDGGISDKTGIHKVKLTRTMDYFANRDALPETGAQVNITDGENTFILNEDAPGVYKTHDQVKGIPGKNYTLNIQLQNGETYTASETMRRVSPIDSVTYQYTNRFFNFQTDEYWYYFYIFAQEPIESKDYYIFNFYMDGVLETDTLSEKFISDDSFIDGNYIDDRLPIYWISDEEVTEQDSPIEIKIELMSITKQYYHYINAIYEETSFNPAGGPPANVPSNVSNDALGYFYAASVTSGKVMVYKHYPPN